MNLNSSPSHFPIQQITYDVDHDQRHRASNLGPNHQVVSSSSSSSASGHFFFSSTQDHAGFYHRQLYQPHRHQDDSYTYHGGSSYEIKNKVESSLKLALWKKEDHGPPQLEKDDQVRWINPSNNNNRISPKGSISTTKIDVQKLQPSPSFETDMSSNRSSYTPIRVCSDCHTTKTPLWRSGPKGPKSLCNACGIRQRKVKRAMAVAEAAANDTVVASDEQRPLKIKVQYKEKMTKNGHSSQFKKQCKMAADIGGSSDSSEKKKLGFEDFLIDLSNKLALHQVFPEDEKDAAILLMALSSGLLHG